MTTPRNAQSINDERFYTWPPTGETFPSVTTIIKGGVPKPALVNWAPKMAAEYTIQNLDLLVALRERSNGDS